MTNHPTELPGGEGELREKVRSVLTKPWLLSSNIWCASADGTKRETVKLPPQPFKVGPSEKTLDEVTSLLTAEVKREVLKAKAMHASDLARAVGLLEGLKYPDRRLTERLAMVEAELTALYQPTEEQS